MRELMWGVSDAFFDARDGLEGWLMEDKKSAYGAAMCRILLGVAVLLLLIGNFSTRQLWIGPASVWAEPTRVVSNFPEIAVLEGASGLIVTVVYLFVLFSAVSFTLGWHTRVASIFTLIGFIVLVSQNPIVGNAADDLIRLALLWMLLIDSSAHWSLDNRRRQRTPAFGDTDEVTAFRSAWNSHETVPVWLSNSLHNIGVAGLAAQTVLIYMNGGLTKIASATWRHGTALYSTMQLPDYRPFPWLSDLFSHNAILLALITYAVLFTQLFFGVFLINRITRRIVIALAIVVNIFFALLMSLAVASLAILAPTALFVSASSFESAAAWFGDVTLPAQYWLEDRLDDLRDRIDDFRTKTKAKPGSRRAV